MRQLSETYYSLTVLEVDLLRCPRQTIGIAAGWIGNAIIPFGKA